jgi:hypothetical protein
MDYSTLVTLLLATPFAQTLLPLTERLVPLLAQLGQTIARFPQHHPTPPAMHQFETDLTAQLREVGRVILEWSCNHCEPDDAAQQPAQVSWGLDWYRRRDKTPNSIATLCGPITLRSYLYEALTPGEPSLHPLEIDLGIAARNATPALAERVGQLAVHHSQRTLLAILKRDYQVAWSCTTLRKVTAALSDGMAEHRHPAQVDRVLHCLREAFRSRGRHRPVLAVGRDGGHLPLRGDGYHEGSVGTLAVYDRQGKRRGTVYLGRMPEAGQTTLTRQMTQVIEEVLRRWTGPPPRLAYVTDGGQHEEDYYEQVLVPWKNPHPPGQRLAWERIIDFYHASSYVGQLGKALFGDSRQGQRWIHRMCQWLKKASHGITRVLQSASAQRNQRRLSAEEAKAYGKAYRYLRPRRQWMQYAHYRRLGLPLGSGVTEAAVKTVFTYRMKQSGMSWVIEGGQVILDLRVIHLSRVWEAVHDRYLQAKAKTLPRYGTTEGAKTMATKKAA